MRLSKTLFFGLALLFSCLSFSQTASVQIIHNSPDLALAEVDVYVDNIKFIDNAAFRTASPFVQIGAGVNVKINLAPGDSNSVADAVYELNTVLDDGETYLLIATGILSDTGYTLTENFEVEVYDMARTEASFGNEIDILVHHGVPDAPSVDINILAPPVTLVNDISYTEFQGYTTVASGDYNIEVTTADGATSVGRFIAPLRNRGMDGEAITVLASGFLNPSQNSNGPAFGLFVARPSGGPLDQFPSPTASAQIIHNSADLAAQVVDVYANGALLIDDFEFRTASPFVDVPATINLKIEIAPSNSTSSNDAIFEFNTTLESNKAYILIADGNISDTGYTQTENFSIEVYDSARFNSTNPTEIDLLVHHGATDAPAVDINVVAPQFKLVDDISYSEFEDYVSVASGDYTLNVITADESLTIGQYTAPLRFVGLEGRAITVVASGFLNPSQNSDGPAFGLWGARPEGGALIKFTPTTAEVQVIHNSADLAASTVDVYLNDQLLLDDFAFRTASPFVEIPAGVDLSIEIAPSNSSSSNDAIFEFNTMLERNEEYILVADGNISSSGYTQTENFSIEVFTGAQKTASSGNVTALLVHHGSTDAPTVDVREAISQIVLVNDISYPSFAQNGYFQLPTDDYFIDVTTADESLTIQTYLAPLSTLSLDGQAITVLASGFLDPSQNSNGAAFGLWAAIPAGGALVELPTSTLGSNSFESLGLNVYPNPVQNILNINMTNSLESKVSIIDLSGRLVMQTELLKLENTIDFSNLKSGIYILNISNDNGTGSLKIVKN